MVCAIPDLDKKKDIQGVLEFLAETCKKDPVPFMTKVRADCGNLVQNVDKDAKPAPSKTFKANVKKFYEEQQRQLQAWEWCGKKSRKRKKVLDLEAKLEFMNEGGLRIMEVSDFNAIRGCPWPGFWPAEGQEEAWRAFVTTRSPQRDTQATLQERSADMATLQ